LSIEMLRKGLVEEKMEDGNELTEPYKLLL